MSTIAPSTTAVESITSVPNNIADVEQQQLHQITPGVRGLVSGLIGLSVLLTIYGTVWLYRHRNVRIVLSHQPAFLITICIGLFLWELCTIPLSFDDGIASPRGCDIACISFQWLNCIGFTLAFAGLYSKLWRMNKIFHTPQFHRIQVRAKDVIKPFAFLFTFNFTMLLLWTIIDPPLWVRQPIHETEEYYTYGSCQSGRIGDLFDAGISLSSFVATLAVIHQAFKARNISSDFSETWPLTIGLLNWIQITIIGIPAVILIGYTVPSATYFLRAALILAKCITMLLAVVCPLYCHPSIRSPSPAIGVNVRVTRADNSPVVTGTRTTILSATVVDDDDDAVRTNAMTFDPESGIPMESVARHLESTLPEIGESGEVAIKSIK
jgi:hypothetical protein